MLKRTLLIAFALVTYITANGSDIKKIERTNDVNQNTTITSEVKIVLEDHGSKPLVINIEDYTKANNNFRTAIWTGKNLQVTLMSIPVGGEIGLEIHNMNDQFLRIEEGNAEVYIGESEDKVFLFRIVKDDDAIFIPAGKWHNMKNIGDKPLKLYSIYAPAEHPHGTIHIDKAASDADHHVAVTTQECCKK